MKKFDATQTLTGPANQGGADLQMETPARAPGFVSDLVVPFGQALTTGALVSGLVAFAASRTEYDGDLLALWFGLALGIGTVAWVLLLVDTRKLLRQIERLTGLDLDGDGTAGDPAVKRQLEVHVKEGNHTRIIESDWLEIDDERLIIFAAGILRGRGLTEAEWGKEKAVFPSGINAWRAFRSRLLDAGLIAWVDPNKPNLGYQVTASGRAFFRRVAELGEYSHTHTHEAQP